MDQPYTREQGFIVTLSTGETVHLAGVPEDLTRAIRDVNSPLAPVRRIDGTLIYLGKEQIAMVAPPGAAPSPTPSSSTTSTTPDLAADLARARHPNSGP